MLALHLLFRHLQAFLPVKLCQRTVDHGGQELQKLGVFHQVIERTAAHHLHCQTLVALAGDDDEGHRALHLFQVAEQVAARHVRQLHVQQHQIHLMTGEPVDGGLA